MGRAGPPPRPRGGGAGAHAGTPLPPKHERSDLSLGGAGRKEEAVVRVSDNSDPAKRKSGAQKDNLLERDGAVT